MKHKVLIIDDEKDICFLISEILSDENYITETAVNSSEALDKNKSFKPDLIILDVWLGNSEMDGIELLIEFKKINPTLPIIVISGHGNIDMAVNSIKNGAYDFLEKPFNSEKLIVLTNRAIENANLIKENNLLKKTSSNDILIVGQSSFTNDLKKILHKISISNSRILIQGPSGSGKKLIAQTIHKLSNRNNSLANIIDFASIEYEQLKILFEDDLDNLKSNIFINSNNGTLIFQNIENASIEFQKKILNYLENPEIFSKLNIKFNIKLISLTSKNIDEEINTGNFTKDLFYRLNVIPIFIPPIKDRREDILPLCYYYLDKFNKYKKYKFYFSKSAENKLETYDWPGNVRQIINYMERLVILNQNKLSSNNYEMSDLPENMGDTSNIYSDSSQNYELTLKDAREKFEKEYFLSHIKRFNGNISKVADFTGMERTALYRKLKSLNINLNNN